MLFAVENLQDLFCAPYCVLAINWKCLYWYPPITADRNCTHYHYLQDQKEDIRENKGGCVGQKGLQQFKRGEQFEQSLMISVRQCHPNTSQKKDLF